MTPITITVYVLAALLTLAAAAALALLWINAAERHKTRQALQRLDAQHAHAQALLDALPFPVSVKNRDGTYRVSNIASAETLGIDAAAIGETSLTLPARNSSVEKNAPVYRLFHESGLEAAKTGLVQLHEIAYLDSAGIQRTGMWWDCPIHIDNQTVSGTLGLLFDITRFREIEHEARATEESLREITRRIPVVLFTLRRDRERVLQLAFLAGDLPAMFGLDPKNLVETNDLLRDWPLLAHIHPEDQTNMRALIRRAALHSQVDSLDFRAYAPDGLRWIHLAMAPRRLPDGSMHWTGYLIDTTNINMHNEGLRAARDAAERASKAKADFLATMSHEIRTPMNGVVGMLELLGHTTLDQEQQELLHAVEDSAAVLLQVLNDVLEFSKLEAGSLRLDVAPFDPRMLVDNIVGSMSAHLHGKGLHVQTAIDAAVAGMLLGDSVRIRQILLNLLGNAGKFTERGDIAIGLRVLGDDNVSQRLRLTVADTGIGIATEKQSLLFTPFSQAESWTTRRYGGTGLGLAICRHLVQLMDGSIQLESKQGVGTTVTVELPLPIARREVKRPPGMNERHAVVRVSSTGTAAALAGYLMALGITVERVPPSEPLRKGLSANLLFVDPGDEESLAAIAAQGIIVDDRTVSRGGSFAQDDLIHLGANPLKWQSVVRACVMALEPINPQPGIGAATASTFKALPSTASLAQRQGRILIAEDHPVGQALARRQFGLLGWPCDIVGDGRAAYEALSRGGYAMLVTDCQMPLMDGYALATAWRRHEAEQGSAFRMPIIAMTASALDGETMRCRAAGMDDFLSKPVQLRELAQMLESWMPHAPLTEPVPATDLPVRSRAFADSVAGTMATDLLEMMLATSHVDLQLLDQSVADGDVGEAVHRLHRMLGALQLFTDAPALVEGRRWLEYLQKNDAATTLQELPPYIDSLRRLLGELVPSRENPAAD